MRERQREQWCGGARTSSGVAMQTEARAVARTELRIVDGYEIRVSILFGLSF